MQMDLLVTSLCLCNGKVLISVQRVCQNTTGRERKGTMEMRYGGGHMLLSDSCGRSSAVLLKYSITGKVPQLEVLN